MITFIESENGAQLQAKARSLTEEANKLFEQLADWRCTHDAPRRHSFQYARYQVRQICDRCFEERREIGKRIKLLNKQASKTLKASWIEVQS